MAKSVQSEGSKRVVRAGGGPMTDFVRAAIRDAMEDTPHPSFPNKPITILALTKEAKIPNSTFRQFMNGAINVISLDDLAAVADAMGRSPAEFLLTPPLRQVLRTLRGRDSSYIDHLVQVVAGLPRSRD